MMRTPSAPRELDLLIVGAGFSGLWLLDRLRDAVLKIAAIDGADGLAACGIGTLIRARGDRAAAYRQFAPEEVWCDGA